MKTNGVITTARINPTDFQKLIFRLFRVENDCNRRNISVPKNSTRIVFSGRASNNIALRPVSIPLAKSNKIPMTMAVRECFRFVRMAIIDTSQTRKIIKTVIDSTSEPKPKFLSSSLFAKLISSIASLV